MCLFTFIHWKTYKHNLTFKYFLFLSLLVNLFLPFFYIYPERLNPGLSTFFVRDIIRFLRTWKRHRSSATRFLKVQIRIHLFSWIQFFGSGSTVFSRFGSRSTLSGISSGSTLFPRCRFSPFFFFFFLHIRIRKHGFFKVRIQIHFIRSHFRINAFS